MNQQRKTENQKPEPKHFSRGEIFEEEKPASDQGQKKFDMARDYDKHSRAHGKHPKQT